jgi:molybdate-binding protein
MIGLGPTSVRQERSTTDFDFELWFQEATSYDPLSDAQAALARKERQDVEEKYAAVAELELRDAVRKARENNVTRVHLSDSQFQRYISMLTRKYMDAKDLVWCRTYFRFMGVTFVTDRSQEIMGVT